VDVGRAETVTINQTLERKTGTLVVNAVALDGSVLAVDGNAIAPGWHGLLPTGSHAVTLTSPATWPQSKSVTVNWNQETDVAMTPTTVATGNAAAFVSQMQAYLGGLGGQYGVYLQDLNSGQEMGSGQDALMEAASVIKIPVALYTYKQVEAKQLKLDDTVTLQDSDFMGGTGVLYYNANAGDKYSYRDLVALLIQQSDNTAWQALRRVLGSGSIDSYAATIGAPQCRQVDDNCTPRQAGLMLAALSRGSLLNATDTQVLLGLLESTVFNDRINFYLSGTIVAHKVGMDGGVMNDSGIVFLPGRPFVISMFTDSDNPDQGVQAIRDVARAAYWYYSH
jgi:beta-lactamase class A